jgi:PX domain
MVYITISDPHTEEEGTRQRYTSYLVTTDKGNSIRRRYSDFLWLYKRLQTELPGAIIPIIPRSRALIASKKFDPDFIEDRRRNLQQFLQGVVDHDELARAPSMSPFMVDMLGSDFDEGKKKVEARTPTNLLYTSQVEEDYGDGTAESPKGAPTNTARKGLSNFFAKIRVSAGSKELMATDNEHEVTVLQEYIQEVAGHLKALVKSADTLVQSTADLAATYDEMGVPIGEWRTTFQQQKEEHAVGLKDNTTMQRTM